MSQPCNENLELFASCLSGLEAPLADELKRLGIKRVRPLGGGVAFFCDVRHALSACLWSRLASRVLVVVGRVNAGDANLLYEGVRRLPWEDVIVEGASMAVQAHGMNDELRNTDSETLQLVGERRFQTSEQLAEQFEVFVAGLAHAGAPYKGKRNRTLGPRPLFHGARQMCGPSSASAPIRNSGRRAVCGWQRTNPRVLRRAMKGVASLPNSLSACSGGTGGATASVLLSICDSLAHDAGSRPTSSTCGWPSSGRSAAR